VLTNWGKFGVGKIEFIVIMGILLLMISLLVFFLKTRDSPTNYLRWASRHHLLGEREYVRGHIEEANFHYAIAKIYREKVFKGE
jgi:uncharacterized membrane protein